MVNNRQEAKSLKNKKRREIALQLRNRLVHLINGTKPAFLQHCEFRMVQTVGELKAAYHLVYLEYLKKGYTKPNAVKMRLSIHQMLRQSTTFIALFKKKYILGTFTLMDDSPLGVPMDKLYKSELDNLRQKGKKITECGMLALNDKILDHPSVPNAAKLLIMLFLQQAGFLYLRRATNVDTVVACFHPRHALFYKAIKFEPLGDLKNYEHVGGNLAVGYALDMDYVGDDNTMRMKEFFGLGGLKPQKQKSDDKFHVSLHEFGRMFLGSATEDIPNG